MNKSIIHLLDTTNNVKIKKYLSYFPINKQIEAYGLFWIIAETLALQNNQWDNLDKAKLLDYYHEDLQEAILTNSAQIDKALKAMRVTGLILSENNIYHSPFQRIVAENYRIKKERISKLEQKVRDQELMIKRLEDKIEYLKNPKPLLKKKIKV